MQDTELMSNAMPTFQRSPRNFSERQHLSTMPPKVETRTLPSIHQVSPQNLVCSARPALIKIWADTPEL